MHTEPKKCLANHVKQEADRPYGKSKRKTTSKLCMILKMRLCNTNLPPSIHLIKTLSAKDRKRVRDRLRNLKAAGMMELIDIYLGRSGRTEGPCADDVCQIFCDFWTTSPPCSTKFTQPPLSLDMNCGFPQLPPRWSSYKHAFPQDRFSATAPGFTQLPSPLDLSGDAKFINSITASYRMNIYLFSLLDQPYISGQNLFLLPICTLLSIN